MKREKSRNSSIVGVKHITPPSSHRQAIFSDRLVTSLIGLRDAGKYRGNVFVQQRSFQRQRLSVLCSVVLCVRIHVHERLYDVIITYTFSLGSFPGHKSRRLSGGGDFRIWTRVLRKYLYFRVIRLDFNPWATADLF